MKQITLKIKNEPGALADLCGALGDKGVNIISIFAGALDSEGLVYIITEDEKTTEKILRDKKINYRSEEIIELKILDRPGELAKVARLLAFERINIQSIFLLSKEKGVVTLALRTDDLEKTKEVLKL
ncbi:MAG: ACT domain-containing protein [archaeon]